MAFDPYLHKASRLQVTGLLLLLILILAPAPGLCYELLIGTGMPGSFSYFAGKTVCRAIAKTDQDLTCQPVPSDNYTDSLTNVLSGSLDLALVNSKTIHDAFHQTGHFRYINLQYDQLRLLMPLYRSPITLLARKDARIESVTALKKKRVNAGALMSLEDTVFHEIMAAQGWREKSFRPLQNLSPVNSQNYLALHNGSTQAMIHIGMHPDRKVRQSLATGQTKVLAIGSKAIDKLIDSNGGFSRQSIAANSYPGQSDPIDTLALDNLLVTSADTDEETVTQILQAIHAAKNQLKYAHPALLQVNIDIESLVESYLHPHPAAILFFQTVR